MSLGIKEERICETKEDNWWPNLEMPGLCGPDSEMFYFRSDDEIPEKFDPDDNRWVEIWNDVFMQYNHKEDGTIEILKHKNVDTGMGLERVTAILEGVNDNYLSSIWKDVIEKICEISNTKYEDNKESIRIIADHIRTSVFISADYSGIKPSNVGQGYILRRLIRRSIRHAKKLNIDISSNWDIEIAKLIINKYKKYYKELEENENVVYEVLTNEKNKFNKTIEKGLREFEKVTKDNNDIDASTAFKLYDTYGFPLELTVELAHEKNIKVDENSIKDAILYQIIGMYVNGVTVYAPEKDGDKLKEQCVKGGVGVKVSAFHRYSKYLGLNEKTLYNAGLEIFEVVAEHEDIINLRNGIDHFKYYLGDYRSMLSIYSEVFDRFFTYDIKYQKNVLNLLQNILLRHNVIVEPILESGFKTIGEQTKPGAKLSIRSIKSDTFQYKVKGGILITDAKDERYLETIRKILYYAENEEDNLKKSVVVTNADKYEKNKESDDQNKQKEKKNKDNKGKKNEEIKSDAEKNNNERLSYNPFANLNFKLSN